MRAAFACLVMLSAAPARATNTAAPDGAEPQIRALLDDGKLEEAATVAAAWLVRAPDSATAHAFMAVTRVGSAARHIITDLAVKGAGQRYSDAAYLRAVLLVLDTELARADGDLAAAAADRRFSLALCPGCWRIDWDGDRQVDENVLAVEHDAAGKIMPRKDPRRRPTFNFDFGDLYYGRAVLSFLRAMVNVGLAYRFAELIAKLQRFELDELALRLDDKSRMEKARGYILAGLDHVDRARTEYLAERDDDREWIPNPRQHDHPVPLPVDDALYRRWSEVVRAVRALVRGDEGLPMGPLSRLAEPPPKQPPSGFLDVSALFTRPRDFVIRPAELRRDHDHADAVLTRVFGDAYVKSMKPSPLPSLMLRANDEIKRKADTPERKQRYLLWLN